jgi:hypothetical protein
MSFVWKITCRRLQSSGALARYAEGALSKPEQVTVETHLAQCSACQTAAADALAVAAVLKANLPAVPSGSLAASGSLWAKIEAEIALTPQEPALPLIETSRPRESAPRLQRFGHWLATPGAMPFGTVAAAAVVGMVGIVVYQRFGFSPAGRQTASITAADNSEFTEINIIPSPSASAPLRAAAGVQEKKAVGTRSALASAVALSGAAAPSAAAQYKAARAERIPSARRSIPSPASPHRRLAAASAVPTAPRAPAAPPAKAPVSFYSVSVTPASSPPIPAPKPVAMADAASHPPAAGGFVGGGYGGSGGGLGGGIAGKGPASSDIAMEIAAVPGGAEHHEPNGAARPAQSIAARVMTSPAPASVAAAPDLAAVASGIGENRTQEPQDVPAARSLLVMALQQRRQRSLFSYATR